MTQAQPLSARDHPDLQYHEALAAKRMKGMGYLGRSQSLTGPKCSSKQPCRLSPTGRSSAARPKCCLPCMSRTFCPAHSVAGQSSALIMLWRPSMRLSPAARWAGCWRRISRTSWMLRHTTPSVFLERVEEVRSSCRYLNSYAVGPSAIDVNGLKLAALYTLQDGLP